MEKCSSCMWQEHMTLLRWYCSKETLPWTIYTLVLCFMRRHLVLNRHRCRCCCRDKFEWVAVLFYSPVIFIASSKTLNIMMNSPQGFKSHQFWHACTGHVKYNKFRTKKMRHFTKCGSANVRLSLRRYGWRIFDNFSEEFLLFMTPRERMDFDVDDSLIQTLSLCFVCAKLQFNLLYGNVCACLHWLNRISFAPVNCHNWSNNKKTYEIFLWRILFCWWWFVIFFAATSP